MAGKALPRRCVRRGCVRLLAIALPVLLSGCAVDRAPPFPETVRLERDYRVERVPKGKGGHVVYPSGHVRLASGETVRLYRERDDDLLILVPIDPDAPVRLHPAPPHLPTVAPPRRDGLVLHDIGDGLPRTGQWRERFTLAAIDARPGLEIVTATPRKSAGGPRVFTLATDRRWQPLRLSFPSRQYDYGSAASGDFDGDGRSDIALAMHLVGFAAFLATPDGMQEASTGLPAAATTPATTVSPGTGRVLLTRPHPDGDRLLLLREAMDSSGGIGLRELQLRDGAWTGTGFEVQRAAGDRMALSSTPRCGTWLAVADAHVPGPHLWRHDGRAWQEQSFDAFPALRTRIADLAFGDIDGDGCDDLAVAYSPHTAGGWIGSVDVFLANRDPAATSDVAWRRLPVWQHIDAPPPGAVGLLRARNDGPAHLAVLDAIGTLRVFSHTGAGLVLDAEVDAPSWRTGCAGRAIAAGDVDGDGAPEWIAAFAGEPTSIEPARCRNGGALAAWKPSDVTHTP